VPVGDDGQESPCNSWGEAIAKTLCDVGHATSMALDTYESPAQACARSAQSDNLHGIDEASMNLIVAEPQASVQTFYVPHRSGELSLTDGALVFRSRTMIVPVSLVIPTTLRFETSFLIPQIEFDFIRCDRMLVRNKSVKRTTLEEIVQFRQSFFNW